MAIAMCDLVLPPNWIIAKTFQFKLLVNLALCINKLNFILFNCITIIDSSRYSDHFDIIYVTISYLEQILHFKKLWKCSKISCDRPSFFMAKKSNNY